MKPLELIYKGKMHELKQMVQETQGEIEVFV